MFDELLNPCMRKKYPHIILQKEDNFFFWFAVIGCPIKMTSTFKHGYPKFNTSCKRIGN